MKSISIIGCNSFLARNLISYLRNSPDQYMIYLYDYSENSDNTDYTNIDFSDLDEIRKIRFDVDSIFIFIGKTGTVNGVEDYQSYIEVNEIYFLNILKVYCEQDTRPRIIYPGTRLIFNECSTEISEVAEINLRSIYAVTKYACEKYLNIFRNIYGLNYVVLRICTPYGTLIDSMGNYGTFEIFWNQAIDKKIITIFGDGNQKKTYTQMSDICKAFKILIDSPTVQHEEYNLGGQALSINDVAATIAKEAGVEIEHVPWPDIYKATDGGSVVFDSTRFDTEFNMTYRCIL